MGQLAEEFWLLRRDRELSAEGPEKQERRIGPSDRVMEARFHIAASLVRSPITCRADPRSGSSAPSSFAEVYPPSREPYKRAGIRRFPSPPSASVGVNGSRRNILWGDEVPASGNFRGMKRPPLG